MNPVQLSACCSASNCAASAAIALGPAAMAASTIEMTCAVVYVGLCNDDEFNNAATA